MKASKITITGQDEEYHVEINRIAFRSVDTPVDSANSPFLVGFPSKKNADEEYKNKIKDSPSAKFDNETKMIDLFVSNIAETNAFTTDINCAPLFPLPTKDGYDKKSYIYIVLIEKGFNVHGYSYQAMQDKKEYEERGAQNFFFGQEICTDSVTPHNVLAAFQITRNLYSLSAKRSNQNNFWNFEKTGTYHIEQLYFNEIAEKYYMTNFPDLDLEKYKTLLRDFKTANNQMEKGTYQISKSSSGYVKKDIGAQLEDSFEDILDKFAKMSGFEVKKF
jgi:hypothetical protein